LPVQAKNFKKLRRYAENTSNLLDNFFGIAAHPET
jgi:hypothetical protein